MERRKFLRFAIPLRIEVEGEEIEGLTKDFSREGLKAVFDHFPLDVHSHIKFKLQRPNEEGYIWGEGEVIWKKSVGEKCEAGIRLKNFPPDLKTEILEQGYKNWVRKILEV